MLPTFLYRILRSLVGHVYPAYRTYQTLQHPSAATAGESNQWLTYWLVIAVFHAGEAIADPVIWWLPLYDEVKLLFILWLLFPTNQGSQFIYTRWIQPYLIANEPRIEAQLQGWRARVQTAFGPQALESLQAFLSRIITLDANSSHSVSVVDFENVSAKAESPKRK